jgi:phosphotransferase system HPr (HPr) family protein
VRFIQTGRTDLTTFIKRPFQTVNLASAEGTVTVEHEKGLHARPASVFVQTASTFECDVKVSKVDGDENANAKSSIAVISLGVEPGDSMLGYPIDVAFIGTCTNGRVSDFRQAARVLDGETIDGSVRGIAVPGSQTVKTQLEAEGIDEVFIEAGFEWRAAGC